MCQTVEFNIHYGSRSYQGTNSRNQNCYSIAFAEPNVVAKSVFHFDYSRASKSMKKEKKWVLSQKSLYFMDQFAWGFLERGTHAIITYNKDLGAGKCLCRDLGAFCCKMIHLIQVTLGFFCGDVLSHFGGLITTVHTPQKFPKRQSTPL